MDYIPFKIEMRATMATIAKVLGHHELAVHDLEKGDKSLIDAKVDIVALSQEYAARAVAFLRQLKEEEIAAEKAERERKRASGEEQPWEM